MRPEPSYAQETGGLCASAFVPRPKTIFWTMASTLMPYQSAWRTCLLASHGAFAPFAFQPM